MQRIGARTVEITTTTNATNGQTVLLSYSAAGAVKIKDLAGNNAAAFTNYAVTNNVAAVATEFPTADLFFWGDGNSMTSNGAAQTAEGWTDRGPAGNTFSLSDIDVPVGYKANAINGSPAITSKNTGGQYGELVSNTPLPALTEATVYVVFKQTAADAALNGGITKLINGFPVVQVRRIAGVLANGVIVTGGQSSDNVLMPVTNGSFVTLRARIGGGIVRGAVNNGVEEIGTIYDPPLNPTSLSLLGAGEKEIALLLIYSVNHSQATRDAIELTIKNKFNHY